MTTPSRGAEIRRRWARARKISTLRRQYQSAKSESDKRTVLEKLNRLVPPMSNDDFLRPMEAKK
jgi:predicted ATPase with chaperone activity